MPNLGSMGPRRVPYKALYQVAILQIGTIVTSPISISGSVSENSPVSLFTREGCVGSARSFCNGRGLGILNYYFLRSVEAPWKSPRWRHSARAVQSYLRCQRPLAVIARSPFSLVQNVLTEPFAFYLPRLSPTGGYPSKLHGSSTSKS